MEKKTSLGKSAVNLTVSKIIGLVISMVTAMLLARLRTVEEYGTYSQLIISINLATTIIMMGLPNSLNYFLAGAETKEERSYFLNVYYSLSTILSVVVGLFLVLIVPLLVRYFTNAALINFLYFLAVFPWTRIIMSSVENVLVVYNRTNTITAFRLLNSALLLGIVVLVQLMNWTFSTYMILYLAVEILFTIVVYVIVKDCAGQLRFKFDLELTKRIFKFSVPLGIASMIGTLNIELDKLVIGGLMDTEHLAIFTNASKEMPVTIVTTSITAVLMPRMVRLLKKDENEKAVNLWSDATYISFTIISFVAFALFVFAPEVITVLYSEKYLAGVSVFRIYSLLLLLRCTYFGMALNASGYSKFIFYSSVASLLLNLTLNYLFFYIFGFIGPALASLLAQLIINLVQLVWTTKVVKIRFVRLFDWAKLGVSLLISLAFATVFAILKYFLPLEIYIGEILESISLGCMWGITYILVMFKNLKRYWTKLNSTT